MTDKQTKIESSEELVDTIRRIGIGLLWAATDLSQNDIAQIMGVGDKRVNDTLKGIKKHNKH